MARKAIPQTPLYGVLEEALKHWSEAGWLGENSLLASPYLLGASLQRDENMADLAARGRILQNLILESANTLDPFDQDILHKTYFSDPKKTSEVIASELGIARSHYFRVRKKAIMALEKVLIERLQPALRLERPIQVAKPIGREASVDHCLAVLQQNQAVALVGAGGIGKTTLGSYIAHQFAPDRTFWFTFHPGFNDQMDSLLFNLGYFFHSHGVSTLWSQILAQYQEGKPLDLAVIQGLIRHDLEQLQRPLLCFDEVDLLKIGEVEAHSQVRTLIESLRGETPILLIGQQSRIESDLFLQLDQLSKVDVQKWLEQQQIPYTADQLEYIHQYTEGNPRLLQLFITLSQMGESFADIMAQLPNEPSVEFLLNRIWQRLDDDEQELLTTLSVFRQPVPREVQWQQTNAQGIWNHLIDRKLVRYDGGGLSLVPAYKAVFYRLLSLEEREFLHHQAALIRTTLTDYTAAVYHYIEANQPEKAVLQWHQYRQEEINRGQAKVAQELFNNVSTSYLSETAREALRCIRAKLALISGRFEEARQNLGNLNDTVWKTPLLKLDALRLKGDLASIQDEFEVAMDAYRDGLERAKLLWEQQFPILHKEASWIYMRQRDMDLAWREAQIAYYEVENLRGNIKKRVGDFSQAERYYQIALELAEELQYTEGIAKTYSNLAGLYVFQGKLDDAVSMSQKSIDAHQKLGRMVDIAGGMANLATFYTFKQEFEQAIQVASEALKSFQIFNNSRGISLACQTLAESYLALNQFDQAQKYAEMVIETEETEGIPDALRVLGEIQLKRGNYPEAQQQIQQSIDLTIENQDPFLEAYGHRVMGQVHQAQQDEVEAKASFDKAIELFEEMELENEIEKTQAMIDHS